MHQIKKHHPDKHYDYLMFEFLRVSQIKQSIDQITIHYPVLVWNQFFVNAKSKKVQILSFLELKILVLCCRDDKNQAQSAHLYIKVWWSNNGSKYR